MLKTVLITGVAGFIGSNLAHNLLRRGYRVVGVDNMSQGEKENLEPLIINDNFEMHYLDILDQADMVRVASNCSAIVHLAAYKIPRYTDALDTLTINSLGSENILKAAVDRGAKVVAASTSDVYGKNPDVPFNENSNLVMGNPDVKRWAYAISKMFEEQTMFAYQQRYGIPVVALRFFGGYGPNQNLTWWGGPQSVFINKALDNEEIEVHGDGKQTRSFTYISDSVDGITRALEMDEANNLVFNLGNTYEISIYELIKKVFKILNKKNIKISNQIIRNRPKKSEVMRLVCDSTKMKKNTKWCSSINSKKDFDKHLIKTIEWYKKNNYKFNNQKNFYV